jgi:hypothetical protein
MKKIIRLTETELINVIKNVVKEQKEIPVVPSDTIVKKVGTNLKIGIEGKSANIYSLYLPVLGKTEITMADLSSNILKIEFAVTYGTGNTVEKKLNDKKDDLKSSGITVKKIEGDTFSRDRFLLTINLKENKKVSQGIINARKGAQYIELASDVSLKIA